MLFPPCFPASLKGGERHCNQSIGASADKPISSGSGFDGEHPL
jgi:hypothetical protein